MDCHDVKNLLSEYIDGMLPEEKTSMVKDHLIRCADCSETYESMRRIIGHMNQMESIDEPVGFLERVNARLERRFSLAGAFRRLFVPLRIKIPLELAGVAAAVALIIYFVGIRNDETLYETALYEITVSMDETTVLAGKRLATGAIGRMEVTTDDRMTEKAEKAEEAEKVEEAPKPAARAKKGPPGKTDIPTVIRSLDGKVIESTYREGTNIPISMIIEIRADRYRPLLQKLAQLGVIRKVPPEISKAGAEIIRVHIQFEYAEP